MCLACAVCLRVPCARTRIADPGNALLSDFRVLMCARLPCVCRHHTAFVYFQNATNMAPLPTPSPAAIAIAISHCLIVARLTYTHHALSLQHRRLRVCHERHTHPSAQRQRRCCRPVDQRSLRPQNLHQRLCVAQRMPWGCGLCDPSAADTGQR